MKKILISLSMIVIIGSANAHANHSTTANWRMKETFKQEFAGAASVQWMAEEEYNVARFELMGHTVMAYFDNDGELIGSMKDMLFSQLPIAVIRSINKHFDEPVSFVVHEISNPEGTFYWLKFDAQNKHYHVKMDANGFLLVTEPVK